MTTCEANGHAKAQAKEQLQDMYESSLRKYPMASSLNKEHFKLAMSMLNDENASFEVVSTIFKVSRMKWKFEMNDVRDWNFIECY